MSLGCVALFFAAAGSRVCFCWRHGRTCLAGSLSDKHSQKRRSKHAAPKSRSHQPHQAPTNCVNDKHQTSDPWKLESMNINSHQPQPLWFQKLLGGMWLYMVVWYSVWFAAFFDLILPRFCGLHPGIPLAVWVLCDAMACRGQPRVTRVRGLLGRQLYTTPENEQLVV